MPRNNSEKSDNCVTSGRNKTKTKIIEKCKEYVENTDEIKYTTKILNLFSTTE